MTPDSTNSNYRKIAEEIASDESPVGIDAKKTHVMILQKLTRLERRLHGIESRLAALERRGSHGL